MTKKPHIPSFFVLVADFLLLTGSFFGMNYWKRGTLELSSQYVKLLIAFYLIWLVVSLFTKKFTFDYSGYKASIRLLARSMLYLVYCAALMVVIIGLTGFSRLQVFGTCGLFFIAEVLAYSWWYMLSSRAAGANAAKDDAETKTEQKSSLVLAVGDFLLVTAMFFIVNYMKRGTVILSPRYEQLLLIIYGLWFVTAVMTKKFHTEYRNYYYAMAQWTKAAVFMAASMAVVLFAFRMFYYSRGQVFGFFILLLIAEAILYYAYYLRKVKGGNGGDIETIDEARHAVKQKPLSLDIVDIAALYDRLMRPIRGKLQRVYSSSPEVFDFLDTTLDLSGIITAETTILHTSEMGRFAHLDERPTRLFINTDRVNDIRWVNRYFLEVYNLLLPGGYFASRVYTTELCKKKFFEKYPKYFRHLFYMTRFMFKRVFPKLPVTKKVYFAITKGKNRAISRAETLGRLCFCGFTIVGEKEIGDDLYFIAQKMKTSAISTSPSYGPLVKLSRLGSNGDIIHTYKFRTMHPYSEYLQDYVYEKQRLQEGGKFHNDFRVTTIGKFMRRIWLDELPMLYNWFKGELQLVGVRPLSMQYANLYHTELQEMRNKVKPGLIPPFFADRPQTFDEICESERCYIEAYLAHPLKTQWVYFWKAVYNIIIKGARSQ
jgi:hypothetical protein